MRKNHWLAVAACAAIVAGSCGAPAMAQTSDKKPLNSQTDLPRHSYPMNVPASEFVTVDDATFKLFADSVLADVNSILNDYDIKDRATLRDELASKLTLQDLLGDNQRGLVTLASLRENQDKPNARLTTGLEEEAILRARILTNVSSGPEFQHAVDRIYTGIVNALPWSVVEDAVKEKESRLEIATSALALAMLKREVDPTVTQAGSVSDEGATAIVNTRHFMRVVQPVQPQLLSALKTYITAHNVEKPDIWPAREVTLSSKQKLTPVLVGIWDSGVDTSLYPTQLYDDPHPGAHSAHGLAFDDEGNISNSDLQPMSDEQRNSYPHMLSLFQGFDDLQNQIDSPEAAAARTWSNSTPPDQLPAMLKLLNFTGNFSHGTHVAGIAARGNPAVRLVVGRFNDNLPEYPFAPTVQWASKFAADFKLLGDYFRGHHVGVVNMSWGDQVSEFETWLAKTSPEQDPAKRKADATAIYQIWRNGIEQAIRSAPDTLFVVAAGNSDSNAGFLGDVPASLHLPNVIAVGAVDQAGEATTFTSYGDTVVVDAAGYRVESFVPGGRTMRFSGTSMASPNVVNLAAKLLALDPALTPAQVISLIRRGADASGDGRLHVINPKRSVALLSARQTVSAHARS